MNRGHLALCIAVFVVTRIYVLFIMQPQHSDASVYAQYAYEYLLASKQHASFYKLHAKRIEAEQREAIKNNRTVPDEEQKIIPYPPLAIQMLRIPSLFIKTDAAWSRESFMKFDAAYQPVFRRMLFLFDLVNFILIVVFLTKRGSALSGRQQTSVALGYILGMLTMPHILYDRLDLAMGTLLLVSTMLVLFKRRHIWSFIALSAAVNFKISPLVLVPLFALATIVSDDSGARPRQSKSCFSWNQLFLRIAAATGCILAFFSPFLMLFGKDSLSALVYQYQRGLHIESFYSAIILFFSAFSDIPCSVGFGYGAFLLDSPLSRGFASVSGFLTLGALGAVYFLVFRWCGATARKEMTEFRERSTERLLIAGQLLCLISLIVFSKNFSPQYLFWLFPVFFLLDFREQGTVQSALLLVSACILTTIIFPYHYFSDIVTRFTLSGKILLVVRAALLAWFLINLVSGFIREPGTPHGKIVAPIKTRRH